MAKLTFEIDDVMYEVLKRAAESDGVEVEEEASLMLGMALSQMPCVGAANNVIDLGHKILAHIYATREQMVLLAMDQGMTEDRVYEIMKQATQSGFGILTNELNPQQPDENAQSEEGAPQ